MKDNSIDRAKISNSIKGLLGHINEPSLGECLMDAFNTNKYTQMIIKYQIDKNQIKDFIKKSKGTRNQFSHMAPIEIKFENANELIMAKAKYILLLRLLMLNDLGITINGDVESYIKGVDKDYEQIL